MACFSATLWIATIIENKLADYCYSIVLLRENNWDNAKFKLINYYKAIEAEGPYLNVNGERVIGRLLEIVTLDYIKEVTVPKDQIIEVSCHYPFMCPSLNKLRKSRVWSIEMELHPELSEPGISV